MTEELTRLADGASAHTSSAHNAARLQTPDHSRFHERAEALAPLLQVLPGHPHMRLAVHASACHMRVTVEMSC